MAIFFEQLSKRERYIFIGTAVVVVLLILDQFAYNPLADRLADAQASRDKCRAELQTMNFEVEQQTRLAPRWRQMLDSGLKSAPEEAESQVLHAFNEWAQDCRVKLTMYGSDRGQETASNGPSKKRLPEIPFKATGEGNMESLARLLWRMQSATIPIRVTKVEASAPKEGVDYLNFKLSWTTIYAPSPRSASQPAGCPPVPSAGSSAPSSVGQASQPAPAAVVRPVPPVASPPSTLPSAASSPVSQPTPATGPDSGPSGTANGSASTSGGQ